MKDFLKEVGEGKAEVNARNIMFAVRSHGNVAILDAKGDVLHPELAIRIPDKELLKKVSGFALTRRGVEYTAEGKKSPLAFNPKHPPQAITLWLSTLKRTLRNVPKGIKFKLDEKTGELTLIVTDASGKITDAKSSELHSQTIPVYKS